MLPGEHSATRLKLEAGANSKLWPVIDDALLLHSFTTTPVHTPTVVRLVDRINGCTSHHLPLGARVDILFEFLARAGAGPATRSAICTAGGVEVLTNLIKPLAYAPCGTLAHRAAYLAAQVLALLVDDGDSEVLEQLLVTGKRMLPGMLRLVTQQVRAQANSCA